MPLIAARVLLTELRNLIISTVFFIIAERLRLANSAEARLLCQIHLQNPGCVSESYRPFVESLKNRLDTMNMTLFE